MKFSDAINRLADHQDLTAEEATGIMDLIMNGRASQAQIGAFLIALRMKGETPYEIAAFAGVMRRHAVPVRPSVEGMLVDTCGTGGTAPDIQHQYRFGNRGSGRWSADRQAREPEREQHVRIR